MISFQGTQLCQNTFVSLLKGVHSKRKEFAKGANSSIFKIDNSQKGLGEQESKLGVTVVAAPVKVGENQPGVSSRLNVSNS